MKKISLLLVVLLAAGSAGLYGQMAIGTEFSISGDAKATLGYDLDARQLGFKNEFSSNISLALVPEASSSAMGDGSGWVGMIELNDFKIVIDPEYDDDQFDEQLLEDGKNRYGALVVTEAEIIAKLVNGPLSLQFHTAPGNVAGKVGPVENDADDDDGDAEDNEDADLNHDMDGMGVAFGYNTDDLGITLGITSEQPYDADEKGDWHVSGDVSVDVGPATIELQVVQEVDGDDEDAVNPTGVAAKISGDVGDLSLSVAVDVQLTGDDDDIDTTEINESLNWEFGAAAGFALTDNTSFDAAFIYSSLAETASDIKLTLTDDGGLVENLSLTLTWGLFDLANGDQKNNLCTPEQIKDEMTDKCLKRLTVNDQMDMIVSADVSYGVSALGGILSPGVDIEVSQIDGGDATVDVTVELVLTETIPMAELGLAWNTKSLFDDTNNDVGTLTAWTKVAY